MRVKILVVFTLLWVLGCSADEPENTEEGIVSPSPKGYYYVSNQTGNDSNNGGINNPWKTLKRVNSEIFKPGNKIFFKKGELFKGHLVLNGSGSKDNPILISSYGDGNKPIISGQVGEDFGGDFQEAILIENHDNLIIENIEIQNERLISRTGILDEKAYGIQILNNGNTPLKNFILRNLTLKNVYAVKEMLNPDDFNQLEVSGIRFFATYNTLNSQKNIQNILIEDCQFSDIQRLGIHFKHAGSTKNLTDELASRIVDVVCRNNEFHYLGGTSILPIRTYNCLIENNIFDHPGANTDPRMPGRGSSVWPYNSINTVIQYNQCLSTRGYFDSHGIHIDHHNKNTFVQYNYMEDCEGGFVEILKDNENAVYRFNISVNDGWRNGGGPDQAWANSNHTLWISKNTNADSADNPQYSMNNYIYNNTVILDYQNVDTSNKKQTTAIEINAKSTYIFNNIFYSVNGGKIGKQNVKINTNGAEQFISNNLYFGDVDSRFSMLDNNPILENPNFLTIGKGKFKYQINLESPVINAGINKTGPPIPGAGTGIFKDVAEYPVTDIFGNPINLESGTPNIGACNIKN